MKILIIGSKGFIGGNLISFLRKKGNHVFGCDVIIDEVDENYFYINSQNSDFSEIFKNNDFDVCINCSGAASVPDSLTNPSKDYELNVHNVLKLLVAIKEFNKNCKFINLSSAAVYGNPESLPIVESQSLIPVSPYGRHKLIAEMLLKEFSEFFGLQTVSLRIFSAYGEGLKKQLFWDLHNKTNVEKPFNLWGTGKESRDFIHVIDVVKIIELIIQKLDFKGQAVNVANGKEVYLKDAVDTYYSLFDTSINYSFSGESRMGDPINWVADISIIKKLGYEQSIDFKEGLKRYKIWLTQKG